MAELGFKFFTGETRSTFVRVHKEETKELGRHRIVLCAKIGFIHASTCN